MEEEWLSCHYNDIRMFHISSHHRSQCHAAGSDNAASLSSACRQIPSSHGTDADFRNLSCGSGWSGHWTIPCQSSLRHPGCQCTLHRRTSPGTGYCGVSFVYRLVSLCGVAENGPWHTHQTCLTAYRRVGDLRSIHRVPNLTDNGVLMVHRAWSDRFRCTEANQPNFRLRKKQIRWDWKKDSSFYKSRLKSISVGGNWHFSSVTLHAELNSIK